MAHLLLNAADATGAGTSVKVSQIPSQHTVQATITGSPSGVTVDLEGSLDDSTYATLASHAFSAAELTATAAIFHVVDKPIRHVRANLTSLAGGSSPTVTVKYEPVTLDRS